MSSEAEAPVLFSERDHARIITLNRPRALNALNLDMVRAIDAKLDEWAADPAARVVVTRGAGEKAFCAGGDVVAIAEAGRSGGSLTADFFREEYQLDFRLAHMSLPHVALMDGITMGGGVGLSVHGAFRVATERTMFAMPETAIGFFPDVGGAHFLPRLDGQLGMYLALSGHRLKGGDVLYSGVATDYVPSARMDELEARLGRVDDASEDAVAAAIADFHSAPEAEPAIFENRAELDAAFGQDSLEAVMATLESMAASGDEWAAKTRKTIARMSPMACEVTFRQIRRGASLGLAEVLCMEYRVSQAFMRHADFYEGIRAVLVDKDQAPVWKDDATGEAGAAMADSYFAELPPERELRLMVSQSAPSLERGLVSEARVLEAAAAAGDGAGVDAVLAQLGDAVAAKPGNSVKVAHVLRVHGRA